MRKRTRSGTENPTVAAWDEEKTMRTKIIYETGDLVEVTCDGTNVKFPAHIDSSLPAGNYRVKIDSIGPAFISGTTDDGKIVRFQDTVPMQPAFDPEMGLKLKAARKTFPNGHVEVGHGVFWQEPDLIVVYGPTTSLVLDRRTHENVAKLPLPEKPRKQRGRQPAGWVPAVWEGTDDPEITREFDCYSLRYRGGTIWLRAYKPEYMNLPVTWGEPPRDSVRNTVKYEYTSSYGANSDNSYSGSLGPGSNGLSLEEAQAAVLADVKKHNGWE